MPNIIVVGVERARFENELMFIFEQVMQGLGLGDDAVVTWTESVVFSCRGIQEGHHLRVEMPYLIIRHTGGMEKIVPIAKALREAGITMDMELEPLPRGGFIPANEMVPDTIPA